MGTRRPTGRGMKASFDIAKSLAENALTIVSGLARGIDGYAHKGALEAKDGKTIAVLASGLDSIYPSDHKRLALQMLEKGSLCLASILRHLRLLGIFPKEIVSLQGFRRACLL